MIPSLEQLPDKTITDLKTFGYLLHRLISLVLSLYDLDAKICRIRFIPKFYITLLMLSFESIHLKTVYVTVVIPIG